MLSALFSGTCPRYKRLSNPEGQGDAVDGTTRQISPWFVAM